MPKPDPNAIPPHCYFLSDDASAALNCYGCGCPVDCDHTPADPDDPVLCDQCAEENALCDMFGV